MSRDEEISDTRTADRKSAREEEDDRVLDQRLTEYLKLGIPAGTLACAAAAGYAQGAAAVVLVLAGGALIAVIAIFWASLRTLVGETPLSGADAYALGAPRAEEEQKRAVLRALKDLEFERSVGKISEEDYLAMVVKYRAEAKRLLRVLDEESQPERDRVEALVNTRLRREGLLGAKEGAKEAEGGDEKAAPRADEKKARGPKARPDAKKKAEPATKCAKCGTSNDADAVFCKKCGQKCGAAPGAAGDDENDDGAEAVEKQEASS
jgi:hypothetical protein